MSRRSAATALGALMLVPLGAAAPLPRPVHVVVPYPPGGSYDSAARVVTRRLGELSSNTFVIDIRAGANGNLGALAVVKSSPDGGTWLFAPDSIVTVNPTLYRGRIGFDSEQDLKVVAAVGTLPSILVVSPSFPAKSLQEFVAFGLQKEIAYASAGIGSAAHLTMEYFGSVAGLKLRHLPYRGGAPAMADLIAGHADAAFIVIGNALEYVRSGALRPLAVSTAYRVVILPDVPTVMESGFPNFEVVSAIFVMIPAKTPDEMTSTIEATLRDALFDSAVQDELRNLAVEPMALSPAQATAWLARARERWAAFITTHNITAD